MAKNKRAPALFDVIHRDVRYQSPVRNTRTPLAWLRKRLSGPGPAVGGTTTVTAEEAANDPTLRPHPLLRGGLGMHTVDSGDRLPAATALTAPQPQARPIPTSPMMQVDRSRQVIRFSLTYTSAGVAAFALLVALSLAYYLGRSAASGPRLAATSVTTEQLRNGPSNPSVLDVGSGAAPVTVANQAVPARNPTPVPPPPPAAANKGQRIVGMNYVIVQSYPKEEDAREAAEILQQHGIPVSVVKGTAFAPRWYSVVGMKPFDHLSNNPEYAAYVKQIKQISDKFAGNSRFKKFEPRPYKWQNH